MNFNIAIIIMTAGIISSSAQGGWSSGGGFVFKDSRNPWFLENTPLVNYCIAIDEDAMGISAEIAATEIAEALEDWKKTLQASDSDNYDEEDGLAPYDNINLGTQRFQRLPCRDKDETISLTFALGTLTADQMKDLPNPRDVIGIAVRQSYDTKNLRASGFVYLAPRKGPLAPSHGNLNSEAWTYQNRLAFKSVLRHEIGHIFGVPHGRNGLMNEDLPDLLVDKSFAEELQSMSLKRFAQRLTTDAALGLKRDWFAEGCGRYSPLFAPWFFDLNYDEEACARTTLTADGELTVEYKLDESLEYRVIGTGEVKKRHYSTSSDISVYLPLDQEVFTSIPKAEQRSRRLVAETMVSMIQLGIELRLSDSGITKNVTAEITPHTSKVAIIEGSNIDDLLFLD